MIILQLPSNADVQRETTRFYPQIILFKLINAFDFFKTVSFCFIIYFCSQRGIKPSISTNTKTKLWLKRRMKMSSPRLQKLRRAL
jgi:hypothetical protein